MILIQLLIVLRPVFLAVLWPVAALVRFVTFASPLVLLFLVVILLHTSGPAQRSFAWSPIATMAESGLVSAALTGLQRKLREDPTQWLEQHVLTARPVDFYLGPIRGPRSARQPYPHPLSVAACKHRRLGSQHDSPPGSSPTWSRVRRGYKVTDAISAAIF